MFSFPGDSNAAKVAALYGENRRWLKAWLYKQTGCRFLAEDLLHDTIERLLKRDQHEPLRNTDAYLKTVAHRLLLDHWRRQRIEQSYLEAIEAQGPGFYPSAEERAEHMQLLMLVDQRLQKLKPVVRQVFLHAQLEGLDYQSVASRLKISVSTVKRHLKQALMVCCFDCL